jgi:glutamate carboxypeptidase
MAEVVVLRPDDIHALCSHLESHSSEMVALLTELVEIESPSTEPATVKPVFDRLAGAFTAQGFRCRRVRGEATGGSLLALDPRRPPHGPTQLLVGHADTVWPSGTLGDRPLTIENGSVRGPGAYDMKAGLVQIVFALDALRHFGWEAEASPLVLINSDEEIGSRESTRWIRRLAALACRAFVMEPGLGPGGALKTARKGLGRYTVIIEGQAAHAGLDPDRGASAILELSHVIQRLFALNNPERGITVNVGTIEGGLRANVVAPRSEAIVDVRVLREGDAVDVDAAIRSLEPATPGTRLEVSGGFGRPPMERTAGNAALYDAARRAANPLGVELEEVTAGGGSDGNTTSQLTPTLDGLGPTGDGAHAPGEHVRISNLPIRTALLAALLMEPADVGRREGWRSTSSHR